MMKKTFPKLHSALFAKYRVKTEESENGATFPDSVSRD